VGRTSRSPVKKGLHPYSNSHRLGIAVNSPAMRGGDSSVGRGSER
jgi:hypothetical protein